MEERRASDQRRHFERHHFEEELQALKNRLLNMGALVEERVHDATHALIERRLDTAERITRRSLDAFVRKDAKLARAILARDDEVDQLKDQVFRVLLTYMMADPGTIERALGLILISRHLERIADHATNIAEDVIFVVEAKDVRPRHEERPGS